MLMDSVIVNFLMGLELKVNRISLISNVVMFVFKIVRKV